MRQLEAAAAHWAELVEATRSAYGEIPLIHLGHTRFSWARYLAQVEHDIAVARGAE